MKHTRPDELDELFAQARVLTVQDDAAAEQAVQAWRRSRRRVWPARLLLTTAVAAVIGGLLLIQQDQPLPTSAAYDVYRQASGGSW